MRITLKGFLFASAVLIASFAVTSAIISLPAPPAPKIKHFTTVFELQLYPQVTVVRTDRTQHDAQTVAREHKGDRLPIVKVSQAAADLLSPQPITPRKWLRPYLARNQRAKDLEQNVQLWIEQNGMWNPDYNAG